MYGAVLYRVCESTGGFGPGWGIEAVQSIARIDDISPDREAVAALCTAMNREKLEPVHMMDVVLDFLP